MKSLFVVYLMIIVSFSCGCINLETNINESYTNYPLYYELDEISTLLPDTAKIPCNVSLMITYPDGKHYGIYRVYATSRNVVFHPVNHTLFQTGIYTAKYEVSNVIKYDYFFAGSIDSRIVFNPTKFEVNDDKVSLKVTNNGKIDGFLYLTLYTKKPFVLGSKIVYNNYYVNDIIFVKNGHFYEFDHNVNSDEMVVLINGELYELR